MTDRPKIHLITHRPQAEPPFRDDDSGQWLGWVILFAIVVFVGVAVWSVL